MITSRRLTVDDVRGQKPSGTPEPHGSDVGTDEGEGARVSGTTRHQQQPWLMSSDVRAVRARTVIVLASTALLTAAALLAAWLTA